VTNLLIALFTAIADQAMRHKACCAAATSVISGGECCGLSDRFYIAPSCAYRCAAICRWRDAGSEVWVSYYRL